MAKLHQILLTTDSYSPMSDPHGLPALYWPSLLSVSNADQIEEDLSKIGWDPQWRFGMYKQAHYHSTTHELLIVIKGQARIQLGGTAERAHPKNQSTSQNQIELKEGDALLLPAGYTHRSMESHSEFTMIGSYPKGANRWDMRFPNAMGCPYDVESIKKLCLESKRKGLFDAQSPELISSGDQNQLGDVDKIWLNC